MDPPALASLEEVPDLLRGRGWVLIGSIYSVDSPEGSLDERLKGFLNRAAGWVAVVLRTAGPVLGSPRSGSGLRGLPLIR